MRTAVRPYVSAGLALVGASVIAVTPIAPPAKTQDPAVQLAASSIANVPLNVIEAIANIPQNWVTAVNEFYDASVTTGNWWVYTPGNITGWTTADTKLAKSLLNLLIPFRAFSIPFGEQATLIAQAEVPPDPNCQGAPAPCRDGTASAFGWQGGDLLAVSPFELLTGYTFPKLINGITGEELPWSQQTVYLDPFAPIKSVIDSLLASPSGIDVPSPGDLVGAVGKIFEGIFIQFYPFVDGSYLGDPRYGNATFLGLPIDQLFAALAPILCGGCDPMKKPYQPAGPEEDPSHALGLLQQSTQTLTAGSASVPSAAALQSSVAGSDSGALEAQSRAGAASGESATANSAAPDVAPEASGVGAGTAGAAGAERTDSGPGAAGTNGRNAEPVLVDESSTEPAGSAATESGDAASEQPSASGTGAAADTTTGGNKVEPANISGADTAPAAGSGGAAQSDNDQASNDKTNSSGTESSSGSTPGGAAAA